MAGAHLSKDFFDLIKAIGEAKSKQEEDRIISIEMGVLKKLLPDRTLTGKRLKEFLIRLLYVEMLGHDASFGYMKSVELSASMNLMEKRVSYLIAGLCFSPEHEFRMMLVNRLQRDLQSANVLECGMALSAASKILTADMIPAVLPGITNLLKHEQELVRKKAIMLLHRFLQLQPESVSHLSDKFRRALCDKCPEVMGASLHIFSDLCKADPLPCKDLVSSFVSILKQIVEHRLPRDFDYHRVPAPWMQIKLLRILGFLGRADQASSEQIYEVLLDVMRKAAEPAINIGYAIVYECVKTVTVIYPNAALLDAAAASIARFISSDNHNLKYLGVTGLASIVSDHPRYAAQHQLAVMDCLEDPDDTLRRKTLDLLYRMTNPVNAQVIIGKLIEQLKNAGSDTFLRTDLVAKICTASERFAPSNAWYIATMVSVFESAGDLVRPEVALNLCNLVAEGGGESEDADRALRVDAVEALLQLLDKPALPDLLLQVMFWILGEYGYLAVSIQPMSLVDKICALAARARIDAATRAAGLSALLKLSAQLQGMQTVLSTPTAVELIKKFGSSKAADLSQRVHEISSLIARPALLKVVLPTDASTEDVSVDDDMRFLDSFVAEALSAGARAYNPPVAESSYSSSSSSSAYDNGASSGSSGGGLRFEAYERNDPTTATVVPGTEPFAVGGSVLPPANDAPIVNALAGLNLSAVKGGWSKEGFKTAQGTTLQEKPPTASSTNAIGANSMEAAISAAVSNANTSTTPSYLSSTSSSNSGGSSKRPWDRPGESSEATPAPAPAAPPPPRELTEKEKMAAALFGGLAASPAPAPAARGGSSVAAAGSSSSRPTPGAASAASSNVRPVAPAPAPVAATKPAAAVDDLLGLFDAPAPKAAAPAAASLDSLFGGGGGGGAVGSMGGFGAGDAPLVPSPAVQAILPPAGSYLREPAAPNAQIKVANDATLSVHYHKVYAQDSLLFVVFVQNNSPSVAIGNAQIQLGSAPKHLAATMRGGVGAQPNVPNALLTGPIQPRGNASFVVSFSLAGVPSASGSAAFQLQYQLANGQVAPPLSFEISSPVSDVLRPAQMDTPQFGAIWQQPAMSAEAVGNAPGSSIRSPEQLMGSVTTLLNLFPVQAISATNEAIAAARVMGLPTVFCLVHATITPQGLSVRVKTAEPQFSQAVAQVCAIKLK
jgi:AP-4 complex subunit epsilon-1